MAGEERMERLELQTSIRLPVKDALVWSNISDITRLGGQIQMGKEREKGRLKLSKAEFIHETCRYVPNLRYPSSRVVRTRIV